MNKFSKQKLNKRNKNILATQQKRISTLTPAEGGICTQFSELPGGMQG